MRHPDEAVLIAFADHELDDAHRGEVAAHVETCAACRYAVGALRDAMAALKVDVALVDSCEPDAWRSGTLSFPRSTSLEETRGGSGAAPALSVVGAATGTPRATSHGHMLTRVRDRWTSTAVLMRAAAILLVVGGGAAAMTAPRWRHATNQGADATVHAAASRVVVAPAAAARPTASAAVSVLPIDGEAIVALVDPPTDPGTSAPEARVVVHVSDRRDVQVTVTSMAGSARVPRFLTSDGRLEVQLTGDGTVIDVDFPSSLRSARVTHDGKTVVAVRGTAVVPAEAASGIALEGEHH